MENKCHGSYCNVGDMEAIWEGSHHGSCSLETSSAHVFGGSLRNPDLPSFLGRPSSECVNAMEEKQLGTYQVQNPKYCCAMVLSPLSS